MDNKMARIGQNFNAELEKIQKVIFNTNKKKISKKQITEMIIKHDTWQTIREEIAEYFIRGEK